MSSYAALAASDQDYEAKRRRTEIENSMRQLRSPAPFQPAAVPDVARRAVARFAERGVRLSAGENGSLLVSPAGQIDSQEREFLVRHKSAIIQYLNSFEVI